ncbi:hypothetical protein D0Z03_002811 [Geotrichum reessii]|nr:hypothetical protein D0Z03_002811 [Galactomyces reessii]
MDLLASYESDSDSSDNNIKSGVPLIPPLTDSSTNSTQCPSTSSTQGFSTDSTQDSQSSSATTAAPRFPTRLPPPQVHHCATTATTVEGETIVSPDDQDLVSAAEQREQLRQLSSPPLTPEIPLLPIAADGGQLVAQFLVLKQQQQQQQQQSNTSSLTAVPVHFNFKFAASPQLHDPTFVSQQAEFLGISDQYVSKFIQPGDRAKARAAVRQRANQRVKVEFTASTNAT